MSTRALGRSRILAGLGICSSVISTLPTRALAQQSSAAVSSQAGNADARRARAAERYREGVEAYRSQRYKDAIDAFNEADSLAPSAALSFNAALAYEQLLDTANALRSYRDYLRRSGTGEKADKARLRIQDLEARLATRGVQQISILSEPPGATVSVDGRAVGVTPWTGELSPGSHHVVLSLKGYEDEAHDVTLRRDHASDVAFTLQPTQSAHLSQATNNATTTRHPLGPWPWIALGAGGAALATSLGFELSRRAAEDDARNATSQTGYADRLDAMDSRQTAARWFAAAGGGLLLASGVLFLLDARAGREASSTGVEVGKDRYFLTYRSSF
ncbi:MAG: PEGA domain-containing protein [Myxococcota bacterium]